MSSQTEDIDSRANRLEEQSQKLDSLVQLLASKVDRIQHYGVREPQSSVNADELNDQISTLNRHIAHLEKEKIAAQQACAKHEYRIVHLLRYIEKLEQEREAKQ